MNQFLLAMGYLLGLPLVIVSLFLWMILLIRIAEWATDKLLGD